MKANRLFWLGRYEERVYMTLHMLRKCYDSMIDGNPEEYRRFWERLDMSNSYSSTSEFTLGMMYDEENPGSIMSSLSRAMDNAIMLRDDLKSETMSYIEMSIALIKKLRMEAIHNVTEMQPLTDWALAFWGSISQRITEAKIKSLLAIGQLIECMDIFNRFEYPYERISEKFYVLKHWAEEVPELVNNDAAEKLDGMLKPDYIAKRKSEGESAFRLELNTVINQLICV